jgi:hypothetical protein
MHYMRPRREKYGRRDHLARTFGITEAEYDALFEAQGGVCYLCHLPEYKVHPLTGKTFALPVDHNHETGEVRGLLCTNCNSGIGLLGDDPERMLAVVEYLLNPPARLILQRVPDLA